MLHLSRENSLGHVINEVRDCHRTMSNIFDQQSSADKLIVELAADYALLVEASVAVMTTRRNMQVCFGQETCSLFSAPWFRTSCVLKGAARVCLER